MPGSHQDGSYKTNSHALSDGVTDNSKKAQIGSIFDSQTVKTNPFGTNVSGDHAYRRAERIAAALVLLTNHINEADALRRRVREAGSELLPRVLLLRHEMRSIASREREDVLALIRETISLVKLLAVSGACSLHNSEALCQALDDLGSFLTTSQRSQLADSIVLSREDLLPLTNTPSAQRRDVRTSWHKQGAQTVKDKEIQSDSEMSFTNKRTDEMTTRASRILDVLRNGTQLGIRDIASNFPEYSEKMIQRELAALVAGGLVHKSGAKRWSRYVYVETGEGKGAHL